MIKRTLMVGAAVAAVATGISLAQAQQDHIGAGLRRKIAAPELIADGGLEPGLDEHGH